MSGYLCLVWGQVQIQEKETRGLVNCISKFTMYKGHLCVHIAHASGTIQIIADGNSVYVHVYSRGIASKYDQR